MQTQLFPHTNSAVAAGLPVALARSSAVQLPKLEAISREEAADLRRCEEAIEDKLEAAKDNFREVGRLLAKIREDRLYRAKYHTWEDYCRGRWQRSGRRMAQFWEAFGVVEDLRANGIKQLAADTSDSVVSSTGTGLPASPGLSPDRESAGQAEPEILPTRESQARPLVGLRSKEERKSAWEDAKGMAGPGKQPTGKQVAEAVAGRKVWPKPNESGVFDPKDCEQIEFKCKGAYARILVVQVGKLMWLSSHEYQLAGSSVGAGGGGGWPSINGEEASFPNREAAVVAAIADLRDCAKGRDKLGSADSVRAAARKIEDWTFRYVQDNCLHSPPMTGKVAPGQQFPSAGQAKPAVILEASQRAVVAIRALQDLVAQDPLNSGFCTAAVRAVERLEHQVKHGKEAPTAQEVVWLIRDTAADLGGLEELLGESGNSDLVPHVGRALAALKPVHDKFNIANMRVDKRAAEADGNGSNGRNGRAPVSKSGFVITRRPLRGATSTSSAKFRYGGNPGGWTPDPNKVTPFKTYAQAEELAHDGDQVETLAQARKRFEGSK